MPILRLIAKIVPSGLETACRFAGSPTSICPSFVNATTEGNALPPRLVPSELGIIVGFPPTIAAAAELLVPTSIPIVFAIFSFDLLFAYLVYFSVINFSVIIFLLWLK